MEDRLDRLTDAQKEALRLFHVRQSAKEIGRALNITHWAVQERLRAARRVLGVATSAEAAALLAAHESPPTYNRFVCNAQRIAHAPERPEDSFSDDGSMPVHPEGGTRLREERAAYRHEPLSNVRLPFPRHLGERNDLSISARLKWIGLLACGIVIAVGALVSIAGGIVRIVAALLQNP